MKRSTKLPLNHKRACPLFRLPLAVGASGSGPLSKKGSLGPSASKKAHEGTRSPGNPFRPIIDEVVPSRLVARRARDKFSFFGQPRIRTDQVDPACRLLVWTWDARRGLGRKRPPPTLRRLLPSPFRGRNNSNHPWSFLPRRAMSAALISYRRLRTPCRGVAPRPPGAGARWAWPRMKSRKG